MPGGVGEGLAEHGDQVVGSWLDGTGWWEEEVMMAEDGPQPTPWLDAMDEDAEDDLGDAWTPEALSDAPPYRSRRSATGWTAAG
jgi:hypothetical protein